MSQDSLFSGSCCRGSDQFIFKCKYGRPSSYASSSKKKKIIIMIIIKIKRSASGWAMGLGGFVKKKKKKC